MRQSVIHALDDGPIILTLYTKGNDAVDAAHVLLSLLTRRTLTYSVVQVIL